MTQYRRKTSYTEAIQFNGANFDEVFLWLGEMEKRKPSGVTEFHLTTFMLQIGNEHSGLQAEKGDYITYEDARYQVWTKKNFESTFEPLAEYKEFANG